MRQCTFRVTGIRLKYFETGDTLISRIPLSPSNAGAGTSEASSLGRWLSRIELSICCRRHLAPDIIAEWHKSLIALGMPALRSAIIAHNARVKSGSDRAVVNRMRW